MSESEQRPPYDPNKPWNGVNWDYKYPDDYEPIAPQFQIGMRITGRLLLLVLALVVVLYLIGVL